MARTAAPAPSVSPEIARHRRQRLLDALGDGLLVLSTADEVVRNGDVMQPFRAGSDFHYLTGFHEPDAVLFAQREKRGHTCALYLRDRDPAREIWDGRRVGVKAAVRRFGVQRTRPIAALADDLPELLGVHRRLFHRLGAHPRLDEQLRRAFAKVALARRRANWPAHPDIVDPLPALAEQRLIKDRHEVALLREAAAITAAGHRAAMRAARPGAREFEVQAALEAEFRRLGAERTGYHSIVASGANACVLHYIDNDRRMRAGELLLVDAGAEYGMYTADITRTFPVDGRFTAAQRRAYRVVLRAQKAAIRAVRPGAAWNAPHRAAVRELTKGMVELGLLRGAVDRLIAGDRYRRYYMHGTSHWLGLDVHDAGPYEDARGKPLKLRQGMVLTVEPGLYVARDDRRAPKELRGLGIRIEDDVLVTGKGNEVLTAGVAKEAAAVEAACAEG